MRVRIETSKLENFKIGLDEALSRTAYGVPVSSPVEVIVESETDAFNFVRRSSAKDLVLDTEYKEWVWDVRPKHSGTYRINVRIVSTIRLDGIEVPFDAFADGKPVHVNWDLKYFLTSAAESKSPEWFSALVVGIWMLIWMGIAGLVRRGWKRLSRPTDRSGSRADP
jgi:hypothetical protein